MNNFTAIGRISKDSTVIKKLECVECGSANSVEKWKRNIPLCKKHYAHMQRFGKIIKRTRFDKNEIFINENYAEIQLYNKECNKTVVTLISLEDIERVKDIKWGLSGNGYVCNKHKSLHRIIINANKTQNVDHINRNILDNRRINLRICNKVQNAINSKISKANSSGMKGVTFDKAREKWSAVIRLDGKNKNLGRYIDKEDAVKAREKAEKENYETYKYYYREG